MQIKKSHRIFKRDNYTCAFCGKKFPINELTLDHLYPVSKGGSSRKYNLVTACKECNFKKSDIINCDKVPKNINLYKDINKEKEKIIINRLATDYLKNGILKRYVWG